MIHSVSHSVFFIWPGIMPGCMNGITGKLTGIPCANSLHIFPEFNIIDIKAVAGWAEIGAASAAEAFHGCFVPVRVLKKIFKFLRQCIRIQFLCHFFVRGFMYLILSLGIFIGCLGEDDGLLYQPHTFFCKNRDIV